MHTLRTRICCLCVAAALLINALVSIAHAEGQNGVTGLEGLRFECLYTIDEDGNEVFISNSSERPFVEFTDGYNCRYELSDEANYIVVEDRVAVMEYGFIPVYSFYLVGEHLHLAGLGLMEGLSEVEYDEWFYRVGSQDYSCKMDAEYTKQVVENSEETMNNNESHDTYQSTDEDYANRELEEATLVGQRFECLYRWGVDGYNAFISNVDERLFIEFAENGICHFGPFSNANYSIDGGAIKVTKWIEKYGCEYLSKLCTLEYEGEHLRLTSIVLDAREDDYDFLLYRVGSETYNRLCNLPLIETGYAQQETQELQREMTAKKAKLTAPDLVSPAAQFGTIYSDAKNIVLEWTAVENASQYRIVVKDVTDVPDSEWTKPNTAAPSVFPEGEFVYDNFTVHNNIISINIGAASSFMAGHTYKACIMASDGGVDYEDSEGPVFLFSVGVENASAVETYKLLDGKYVDIFLRTYSDSAYVDGRTIYMNKGDKVEFVVDKSAMVRMNDDNSFSYQYFQWIGAGESDAVDIFIEAEKQRAVSEWFYSGGCQFDCVLEENNRYLKQLSETDDSDTYSVVYAVEAIKEGNHPYCMVVYCLPDASEGGRIRSVEGYKLEYTMIISDEAAQYQHHAPSVTGLIDVSEGETVNYQVHADGAVKYIEYLNGQQNGTFEAQLDHTQIPLTYMSKGRFLLQFSAVYADGTESEKSERLVVTVKERAKPESPVVHLNSEEVYVGEAASFSVQATPGATLRMYQNNKLVTDFAQTLGADGTVQFDYKFDKQARMMLQFTSVVDGVESERSDRLAINVQETLEREKDYTDLLDGESSVVASLGDGLASYVPTDIDIIVSYEDDNGYSVKRSYLGGSDGSMSIVSFRDTIPIQVTAQDANGKRLAVNKGHNNILDEGDLFWEWSGDVDGSGIGADFNLKLNSWNILRGAYSSSATIKLCRVIKKGPLGKNETLKQIEFKVERNYDARFELWADNAQQDGELATVNLPINKGTATVKFYVYDYEKWSLHDVATIADMKLYIDEKIVSSTAWYASPYTEGIHGNTVSLPEGEYQITLKYRDDVVDEMTLKVVNRVHSLTSDEKDYGIYENIADKGTKFKVSQSCVWINDKYEYVRDFDDARWKKISTGIPSDIDKKMVANYIAPSHMLLLTNEDALLFASNLKRISEDSAIAMAENYIATKLPELIAGEQWKKSVIPDLGSLVGFPELDQVYEGMATEFLKNAMPGADEQEPSEIAVGYVMNVIKTKIPVVALIMEGYDLAKLLSEAYQALLNGELAEDITAYASQGYGVTIVWGYHYIDKRYVCRVYGEPGPYSRYLTWTNVFTTPKNNETEEALTGYVVTDAALINSVYTETLLYYLE